MVSHKKKQIAEISTPETKSKKTKQPIFVTNVPWVGELPMLFYIPNLKSNDKLRDLIESNGGMIVDMYEAFVYQISATKTIKSSTKSYYRGYIYHSKWITDSVEKRRLQKNNQKYLIKLNKSSKLDTIPKGTRRQYTISEVFKLFELCESYKGKECPPMNYFHKIATENFIPDRSAESLRTAWKKFSVMGKPNFLKGALNKKGTRYSHIFEKIPNQRREEESKEPTPTKKNLNSTFSTNTKAKEELSSTSEMHVDLDVMTKEPTFCDNQDIEFVLEIEDLQSVISNYTNKSAKYNLNPVRKRKRTRLDEMFSSYANVKGNKRVKITEHLEDHDFNEADSVIYDQEDLLNYINQDSKIQIQNNLSTNTRIFKSAIPRNKDLNLFREINAELDALGKEYGYSMEEIHTFWMEAWCDIDELKKVLKGDKKRQWTTFEDFALQSEPGSQEYEYIKKFKDENEIKKRRKFLEIE